MNPPLPPGFPLQSSDMNFPNPLMALQKMMQANSMLNQDANKFLWNFVRRMPSFPPQPLLQPVDPFGPKRVGSKYWVEPVRPNDDEPAHSNGLVSARSAAADPPPLPSPVPHPSQTLQQQPLGFGQMSLGFGQQMQFQNMQMYYANNNNNSNISNNNQNQMGVRQNQMTAVVSQDLSQGQLALGQTSQNGGQNDSQNAGQNGGQNGGAGQQEYSAAALQQYFSSPEAIQSLLSDRDKLW